MKNIEVFMAENRASLPEFEPSSGHEKRFRQRRQKSPGIYPAIWYTMISATACFAIIYSLLRPSATELPLEVHETGFYFEGLCQTKVDSIRIYLASCPGASSDLSTTLEDLDNKGLMLMNDLKTNPGNEQILHALVMHYQKKLEVLSQMLNQIKKTNTINHRNHESISI